MHSTKRLDEQPRAHRLDLTNRCALSDCCGAPIIRGGICFDCRELCEEDDGDSRRPARLGRTSITGDDPLAFARVERPNLDFRGEDSSSAFDAMVMKIIAE